MTCEVWQSGPDGTKTLIGIVHSPPPLDIDLSLEGRQYTKDDVQAWRQARYEELLAKEVPNKRSRIVSKDRKAKVFATTWKLLGRPKVGQYRPPQDSPQLMALKRRLAQHMPSARCDLFMKRMWGLLTGAERGKDAKPGKGSIIYFRQVLAIFASVTDEALPALASALFSHSVLETAKTDYITIPTPLLPLLQVCSKVDGRGELLSTFLFWDVIWLPGTEKYDLKGETGMWHVKELKANKIRMGGSHYTASDVAEKLTQLTKDKRWDQAGKKTNTKFALSKAIIRANAVLITEVFGSVEGFWAQMNALLQQVEAGTQGTLFFKGCRVYARLMKDVRCVGATKGDLEVTPGEVLPAQDLANVAA